MERVTLKDFEFVNVDDNGNPNKETAIFIELMDRYGQKINLDLEENSQIMSKEEEEDIIQQCPRFITELNWGEDAYDDHLYDGFIVDTRNNECKVYGYFEIKSELFDSKYVIAIYNLNEEDLRKILDIKDYLFHSGIDCAGFTEGKSLEDINIESQKTGNPKTDIGEENLDENGFDLTDN